MSSGALDAAEAGRAQGAARRAAAHVPVPDVLHHRRVGPRADPAQGRRANSIPRPSRWCRPTRRPSAARSCARRCSAASARPPCSAIPATWVPLLIEANRLLAAGQPGRGRKLRDAAFEAAPASRRRAQRRRLATGSPTPTRGSARCSRRSSTATTCGSRSHRVQVARHRAAGRSARPGLDAGPLHLDQRRRGRRLHPDPLSRLRRRRPTRRSSSRARPTGSSTTRTGRCRRPAHAGHRRRTRSR